jgi:hypothetical protein
LEETTIIYGYKRKVSAFCFHFSDIYNHFIMIGDNLVTFDNLRVINTWGDLSYRKDNLCEDVTNLYVPTILIIWELWTYFKGFLFVLLLSSLDVATSQV